MDALSHILNTIQLSARPYLCKAGGGPWKIQFQYRPQGIFHLVTRGQCYVREGGSKDLILLQAGDGVIFPTGGAHWICDSPDSQALTAQNVLNVAGPENFSLLTTGEVTAGVASGGQLERGLWVPAVATGEAVAEKPVTMLLSGTLSYDSSIDHPFLKSLPCFINVSSRSSEDQENTRILANLLIKESIGAFPGRSLMVDHLAEVFFIQLLRVHMHKARQSDGFLAALSDPQIGMALNLIHTEADRKWTVDSLCSASAMGRTAFTRKFTKLVGITPKAYLTNMRLMGARFKLQNSNKSTIAIAEDAGYNSEASFSRAIKKHFNKTPGELRKQP